MDVIYLINGDTQIAQYNTQGYLHDYRMEQARQLLLSRQMKIEQVAQKVSYANRSRFASTFRKKYGVNPKAY
ncbi:MAG: helix-turn-helix domain-containing protein [Nostoc sp.]|uniref:helix-turn-helix domain-containing protein n=1 Tax=Nostoc sp. TaxID=1180 RepID=UPI002FF7DDFF